METVKLPYATDGQEAALPPDWKVDLVQGSALADLPDPATAIVEALEHPIGAPPLRRLLQQGLAGDGKVLVMLSDRTRKDGKKAFLPPLLGYLGWMGIAPERIDLCFCRGTHRQMSRDELMQMVGEHLLERHAFFQHDCDGAVRELGVTARGTPIGFNARLWDYRLLLPVCAATHHYLAGFGGGCKMFVPGVAARRTIQGSHELCFRPTEEGGGRRPGVEAGVLEGNAVHEEFLEATRRIDLPIFLLCLLTGKTDGAFAACYAGDLIAAHQEACRAYMRIKSAPFSEPYDLVISASGGAPTDTNLVQAHKGLDSAFRLVKPGGVMVHLAACTDGLGGEDLRSWIPIQDLAELERKLRARFAIYGNTVYAIKCKAAAARIFLVSQLPDETVRQCGMTPAPSLEAALSLAAPLLPPVPRTALMPNAGSLLPRRVYGPERA